jgi:hypothetical protein
VGVQLARQRKLYAALCAAFAIVLTGTLLAAAGANAHPSEGRSDGRIPGMADFESVGGTTYRYMPGKAEYEVRRPGIPPSYLHADTVAEGIAGGSAGTKLPTQTLPPICRSVGPRIVVVFTHTGSETTPVATLRNVIERMNWKIADQSGHSSGNSRSVRMAVDCNAQNEINVYDVKTTGGDFASISEQVQQKLSSTVEKGYAVKYLVFDGWWKTEGIVGQGQLRDDNQKSRLNLNARISTTAVVYNNWWDTHVALHEMFHSLGATQGNTSPAAPYSTTGYHCVDGIDLLCYADGTSSAWGGYGETMCSESAGYRTPVTVPVDCGNDTYFDAAPAEGSYLAAYWNTATGEDPFLAALPTEPPLAATYAATLVKRTSATLNGEVTPRADLAHYQFQYVTDADFQASGWTKASLFPAAKKIVPSYGSTSSALSESAYFKEGTKFHYRLVATNESGQVAYGSDQVFTTPALPTVEPELVNVAERTALIRAVINPRGSETKYLIEWGEEDDYSKNWETEWKSVGAGTSGVPVSYTVEGLDPAKRYYVAVRAQNVAGPASEYLNFATKPMAWTDQTAGEPAGAKASRLLATSCTTATQCSAVGWVNMSGTSVTLAQRTNGSGAWVAQSTPNPAGATESYLEDVSCASSTACTAVGYFKNASGTVLPLAEHWNGSEWSIATTPLPAGATSGKLKGVSCISATSCSAVGNYQDAAGVLKTLAERRSGSTWAIETTPNPGTSQNGLSDVSCASSTECWAVGEASYKAGESKMPVSLAMRWNGSTWSAQTLAAPVTGLDVVSCPSTSFCMATGESFTTQRWNGSTWTQGSMTPPNGGEWEISGVSCVSSSSCVAVGFFASIGHSRPLSEHWNGTSWSAREAFDKSGSGAFFSGVSCLSPTSCVSVGRYNQLPGPTSRLMAQKFKELSVEGTPPKLEGAQYPIAISGTQTSSHGWGLQLGNTSCGTTTFSSSVSGPATQVSLGPVYGSCSMAGFATTVKMNGCSYLVNIESTGPPSTGRLDVVCPAGKSIEFSTGKCKVTIPAQTTNAGGLALSNGPNATIGVGFSVSGIKYQQQPGTGEGTLCTGGEFTNGTYTGTSVLTGSYLPG